MTHLFKCVCLHRCFTLLPFTNKKNFVVVVDHRQHSFNEVLRANRIPQFEVTLRAFSDSYGSCRISRRKQKLGGGMKFEEILSDPLICLDDRRTRFSFQLLWDTNPNRKSLQVQYILFRCSSDVTELKPFLVTPKRNAVQELHCCCALTPPLEGVSTAYQS